MNLYGKIDFSGYFGVEYRVLDGEEYICIPRRFNPSIPVFSGHPVALLKLIEREPDADGNTFAAYPHIPRSVLPALEPGDIIRMTRQVGAFRVMTGANEKDRPIGQETLATNPVNYDDIPL